MTHFLKKVFPILQWLPDYKGDELKGDFIAGITVGIMLIPQGMAYALIAGLPPVYGLYASIVPQIIYALLGTSRQLSVAPVAMDSLLVAAGVSVLATEGTETYIAFAILLAFFMGVFQLLLGFFKMGFITNLLSRPVISGFTSAAAIIIGVNQVKYLIGVEIEKNNSIFQVVWNMIQNIEKTHVLTLALGVGGIIIISLIRRVNKRIPGALVAVAVGTGLVYSLAWQNAGVDIVAHIPEGLPPFQLPNFQLEGIMELAPLALTLSVIAFMESFSVAKALESQRRDHKVVANRELVALGAANFIGSLFQSFPVAGGFSRSAVNYEAGAKTPMASIFSAIFIMSTLLFFTPLFYYLPKAVLASVIMVAVSNLIDIRYAQRLFKKRRIEFGLLIVTFIVTISFSLVAGIVTGVAMSILVLLYQLAYPHIAQLGRLNGQDEFRNIQRFEKLKTWPDKLIIRVDAPITFINIHYVREYIEHLLNGNPLIKHVLLDASAISHIDASAAQGLTEMLDILHEKQVSFAMSEVVGPVRDMLYTCNLIDIIGEENIFLTMNDAIEAPAIPRDYRRRKDALQHGKIQAD